MAAPMAAVVPRAFSLAGPLTAPFAASAVLRVAAVGLALRLDIPRRPAAAA
jgi:hypothetical protein